MDDGPFFLNLTLLAKHVYTLYIIKRILRLGAVCYWSNEPFSSTTLTAAITTYYVVLVVVFLYTPTTNADRSYLYHPSFNGSSHSVLQLLVRHSSDGFSFSTVFSPVVLNEHYYWMRGKKCKTFTTTTNSTNEWHFVVVGRVLKQKNEVT